MVNKKAVPESAEEPPEAEVGIVVEYVHPPAKENGPAKINRRYWDKIKDVTDTTALKGFTRGGGFTGTDINPTWRMERMTEVFGPVGWGWGYEVVKRWSETFKTVKKGEIPIVFTTVRCWYVPINEEPYWPKNEDGISDRRNPPINALWTGEQDGGTEVTDRGTDEVYKQAITDAYGKACAQVGLGAAIYRGKWDDSKYKEDQERFSQMEGVKKYLETLIPELEGMTDTRELRGLRNRASFIANQRTAHEVNFKLGNEFDAIVKEHENRVALALWAKVREALIVEDLEVLNGLIDGLKPQITALPDERDIAEMRTLVATRKAELKKAMEPKEEEPKQASPSFAEEVMKPSDHEALEVPHKNGHPQWGTFTKMVLSHISGVMESDPRPPKEELEAFYQANAHHFEAMEKEGGEPLRYTKRIASDYEAAIKMLED
jgi:hypothetical protein